MSGWRFRVSIVGFVLALVGAVAALVVGVAALRYQDYKRNHAEIAFGSVTAAASEVELLVVGLGQRVARFVEERAELLVAVAGEPFAAAPYERLRRAVERQFPERLSFEVTDRGGASVLAEFGRALEPAAVDGGRPVVLRAARSFEADHFDIAAPWSGPAGERGLFILSVDAQALTRLLRNTQAYRHNLVLVREDQGHLIEVMAEGSRRVLSRPARLSRAELGAALQAVAVPGTGWVLVDLPKPGLFATKKREIMVYAAAVLLIVAVLTWLMLLAIRREEKRRARAEWALIEAKERAERSDRMKSQFLASMSHELRTPLNAIIGFSEVLKSGMLGPVGHPKYMEYVGDIHEAGSHLLRLINDLLDLAKIEAGRFELEDKPLSLSGALNSCLRLVTARAAKGGVRLASDPPGELPPVWGDERKLKQVFLNLLSNAVKFTPAGGEVRVSTRCQPDGAIAVQVQDSGIGMKPDEIDLALQPFRQLGSPYVRRHEGSGLGLPLSKYLVELHGGRLHLASTLGVGTTVTVTLPPHRAAAKPNPRLHCA
jgi:signal transduction histidine kinase